MWAVRGRLFRAKRQKFEIRNHERIGRVSEAEVFIPFSLAIRSPAHCADENKTAEKKYPLKDQFKNGHDYFNFAAADLRNDR